MVDGGRLDVGKEEEAEIKQDDSVVAQGLEEMNVLLTGRGGLEDQCLHCRTL